jgi:hypothetical protein
MHDATDDVLISRYQNDEMVKLDEIICSIECMYSSTIIIMYLNSPNINHSKMGFERYVHNECIKV